MRQTCTRSIVCIPVLASQSALTFSIDFRLTSRATRSPSLRPLTWLPTGKSAWVTSWHARLSLGNDTGALVAKGQGVCHGHTRHLSIRLHLVRQPDTHLSRLKNVHVRAAARSALPLRSQTALELTKCRYAWDILSPCTHQIGLVGLVRLTRTVHKW